ncbi:MAG: hypothetical protein J5806_12360 [Lentisphaeria bacterium]|nr:hypothetical protein [Lentisphaeria bacterium]
MEKKREKTEKNGKKSQKNGITTCNSAERTYIIRLYVAGCDNVRAAWKEKQGYGHAVSRVPDKKQDEHKVNPKWSKSD